MELAERDPAALLEATLLTDPRYANIAATGSDKHERLLELNDEEDRHRQEQCRTLIDDIISHAPLRYTPGSLKASKRVSLPNWHVSSVRQAHANVGAGKPPLSGSYRPLMVGWPCSLSHSSLHVAVQAESCMVHG